MSTFDTLLALVDKFSDREAINLHPERCLNTRFRMIECSLCADVCPAEGAITVTNGKPALDNEACLHCGLCLHRCPTEAFTQPDGLPGKLVKTATALAAGQVDLVCPHHPHPERGPAPQAVQIQRCLAMLSPATLFELSTLKREIWLDDGHCAGCPLGQVHTAVTQTVNEANSWASLLKNSAPILLRTGDKEKKRATLQRPVYNAATPPVSRRRLFDSFKQVSQEVAEAEEKVEMLKAGKSVPVSERLPQAVPHQRGKILSLVKHFSSDQPALPPAQISNLPILNLQINPARCTACTLCAKFCPTGALKYLSDGQSFALTFQLSLCLGPECNICLPACPEQAVSSQPFTESSNLFTKKPVVTGDLTLCQGCQQAIADGPDLPKTCFACRPKTTAY